MRHFNWFDPRQAVLLLCAIVLWMPGAMAAEIAGSTHFVSGKVTAKSAQTRNLSKGASIYSKDVVETGADGRVQMRFTDGGLVSLMPNSIFAVDEYRHDAQQEDGTLVFSLMKGGLRTVTGAIGKKDKANYKLQTPVGTLGIRGTEFVVVLNGPDVMQVHVGVGAVFISNDYGGLGVPAGQSARMERGRPPVLTNEQPNFMVRAVSPARAQQPPQDEDNSGPGRADIQLAQAPMPPVTVSGTENPSGDGGVPGGDGSGTPGGDGGGTPGGDNGGPAADTNINTGMAVAMHIDGDGGDASLTSDVYRMFAANGRALLDGSTGILKAYTPDGSSQYSDYKLGDAGATMQVVNRQSGAIDDIQWALVRTRGTFPDDVNTWDLTGLYMLGNMSDVRGEDLVTDSTPVLSYSSVGATPLLDLDGNAVGTMTAMKVNFSYDSIDQEISADFNMELVAPDVYEGGVSGSVQLFDEELYLYAGNAGFASAEYCDYSCELEASGFLNGDEGERLIVAYQLEKGTAQTNTTGQWDTYLGGAVLEQSSPSPVNTGMLMALTPVAPVAGLPAAFYTTGDVVMNRAGAMQSFADDSVRYFLGTDTALTVVNEQQGELFYQNEDGDDVGIKWGLVSGPGKLSETGVPWQFTGLYMLADRATGSLDTLLNTVNDGAGLYYESVQATDVMNLSGEVVGSLDGMSMEIWLNPDKVQYRMFMGFDLNDSEYVSVRGNGDLDATSTAFLIQGNEFEVGRGGTCSGCSLDAGVVLMGEELNNAAVAYELKVDGDTYLGGAVLEEIGPQ